MLLSKTAGVLQVQGRACLMMAWPAAQRT